MEPGQVEHTKERYLQMARRGEFAGGFAKYLALEDACREQGLPSPTPELYGEKFDFHVDEAWRYAQKGDAIKVREELAMARFTAAIAKKQCRVNIIGMETCFVGLENKFLKSASLCQSEAAFHGMEAVFKSILPENPYVEEVLEKIAEKLD